MGGRVMCVPRIHIAKINDKVSPFSRFNCPIRVFSTRFESNRIELNRFRDCSIRIGFKVNICFNLGAAFN